MIKRVKAWFTPHGVFLPSGTARYLKLIVIAAAIIGIIPIFTQSTYLLTLLSYIMIYSMLALSIDLLSGFMGLGSLGHAGFFGAAAYCCGYLNSKLHWGFLPCVLATMAFVILLAMLFGLLTSRTWGVTFMMVNLALSQIILGLAVKLTDITGGDNGMVGITRPTFLGIDLSNDIIFYYFLFAVFALMFFLVYRLVNSPFGMGIQGVRQSPKRMKALGVDVLKYKFITFVISGTLAGIAGMMFCFFNCFVSPPNINTQASSKAFLMSLVGGKGTLGGSIIGAGIVVILENFISAYTARWQMALGILYVLTVTLSPNGIIGIYRKIRERIKSKRDFQNQQILSVNKNEEKEKR